DIDQRKRVFARAIGNGRASLPRGYPGDRHSCSRDDRAAGVADRPQNFGCRRLCLQAEREYSSRHEKEAVSDHSRNRVARIHMYLLVTYWVIPDSTLQSTMTSLDWGGSFGRVYTAMTISVKTKVVDTN